MRLNYLIVFCLVISFGLAQNHTLRLFNEKDGLADPFVYSMIQDKEGFLFVATGKGLQKFDGQLFSNVELKKAADELLYAGAVTKGNQLWFGTFNGNLYYYNYELNALKRFSQNIKGSIHRILPLKNSIGFCVLSKGNGVFITNGKFLFRIPETEMLQINGIDVLSEDKLLAACDDGLYVINIKTNTCNKLKGMDESVKFIQRTSGENFMILSQPSGISEMSLLKDSVHLNKLLPGNHEVITETIHQFYYHQKTSELFLSGQDESLSVFNFITGKWTIFPKEEFSATVNGFFADSESNIWMATTGKGLYRLSYTDYSIINSGGESVYAITQDQLGRTYFGSKEGILVKDANDVELEKISVIDKTRLGKINALYYDSEGLWIGTDANGLLLIDPFTKKRQTIEFSEVTNISVNSITGRNSKVAVTTNLDGVFIYKGKQIENHFSVQNGLIHNNVYYAWISKSNKIYYATHNTAFNYSVGKELFELDVKAGGLNADFNSFAEDSEGNIFIATNGDGVYMLKDNEINVVECNHLMATKYITGLLADAYDNLWVLQSDRLYQCHVKKQILKETNLNVKTELAFNQNATFQNQKGEVFVGADKYALVFHPDTAKEKLPKPYLIRIHVNDSLKRINEDEVLPSGIYDIEFEFSALCLKNSEAVRFSYVLEGRDNDWSEPSAQRKIRYSKLTEGSYTLKVRAYNSKGFMSELPYVFHFDIDAPFWKKPLFWGFMLVLLSLGIYVIVRKRTEALIRSKIDLEKKVAEKTKELQEEKEIVLRNKQVIEEQNAEIMDSITYAKRIQEALLTDKELIYEHTNNLFVFYQPRDIVSGDFYWMGEVNGIKIVVAADCTGHGVPGALMSMIGSTLLNKIIIERQITGPKEILKQLDSEIKITLKQHTDFATRDGMDVCLCCIDEKKGLLTYAGAMRPLYQLRNNEIMEHAPTKHAIGGFSYGKTKEFSETRIRLKKNDIFYLFSDGYADQFGGDKGKKLMLKNFRTLLLSVSHMEMQDQKAAIARYYKEWKGETPQIDDVLVIGIKI